MPELPEVETVARTLRPHVQGSIIADAHVLRATSLHPLSLPLQRLRGCRIADVARRGKLLLLLLDPEKAEDAEVRGMKDLRLAVHLRMTGRLMTYAAKTAPGTHTRCIFDLTALPGPLLRLHRAGRRRTRASCRCGRHARVPCLFAHRRAPPVFRRRARFRNPAGEHAGSVCPLAVSGVILAQSLWR